MTDTRVQTVEIPADDKDNSRDVHVIGWHSARRITEETLADDLRWADHFRYTVHTWDDVDRDGHRVTLVRFITQEGGTRELYEVSYFTRVACSVDASCPSWSHVYVVHEYDGVCGDPKPMCSTHLAIDRSAARHDPLLTLHVSESLRVGQH